MVRSDGIRGDRLRGRVGHHKTVVVTEHGVADSGIDAHARRRSDHDQLLDAPVPQDLVQIGPVERGDVVELLEPGAHGAEQHGGNDTDDDQSDRSSRHA